METVTEKELLDNQDLIDDFMGKKRWRMHHNHEWRSYHNSWNMLMTVVEKIEAIEGVRFVIEKNRVLVCTYAVQPEYFWNSGTTSQTKLQTTYDAVTEFIKWYNQKSLTS